MSLSSYSSLTARDPHNLRHHYQRVYNAKPSPQIAQTRKPRPATSNIGSRKTKRHPKRSQSNNTTMTSSDYWTRKYVNDYQVVSSDDEHWGLRHNNMKAPSLTLRSSLNDLSSAHTFNTGTNMSGKIDRFLDIVQRCELELQEELKLRKQKLEAKKTKPPWYRSMSSLGSGTTLNKPESVKKPMSRKVSPSSTMKASKVYKSSNELSDKKSALRNPKRPSTANPMIMPSRKETPKPPKSRPSSTNTSRMTHHSRPLKAFPTTKKVIKEYPLPDTSKVQSKLREDRNYQPPRHKRYVKRKKSKKVIENEQNSSNEYEDDFEDDEDEEEEEDVTMTKEWINDQARRGMARQRAIDMSKSQFRLENHEKDSSKDSAYGYSGGESRLATREPTPDAFNYGSCRRGSSNNNNQKNSKPLKKPPRDLDSDDEKSSAYVNFVNKVTGDILKRGVFTDKALKEALEANSKRYQGITPKEISVINSKLRKELGISSNGVQSLNTSLSEANLHDLLQFGSAAKFKSANNTRQPPVIRRKMKKEVSERPTSTKANRKTDLFSEQELADILLEVDLDDNLVHEVIRNVRNPPPKRPNELDPHLFDSLNISNLNISFNASAQNKQSRNEKKRESLIKSFAHNSSSSENKNSAEFQYSLETPRSSSLYHPETEDDEEDLPRVKEEGLKEEQQSDQEIEEVISD